MIRKLLQKVRQATPKQLVVAGAFTVALAGAIAGGMAFKQSASAAQTIRDCDHNSINYVSMNGGCGALTASEVIADLKDNKPGDLKAIYGDAKLGGLTASKYDRFVKTARHGVIKRNGDIVVDGQVVMSGAWTMGRTTLGSKQREPIYVAGKKYYHSHPSVSFASSRQELDVIVMFDANGVVEVAIMESCGNPITKGDKKKPVYDCEDLTKKDLGGNKYEFTTKVSHNNLVTVAKVEYFVDGVKFAESSDKNSGYKVTYTFSKSAEVTTKVHFNIPGKQTKVVVSNKCKEQITVKIPFYTCEKLIATARDNTNRNFRFTVIAKYGNGATLKNADFSVDGKVVAKDVTAKDGQGNIFKDLDFEAGKSHTISAVVKFTLNGQTVNSKEDCVAKVKTPEDKKPFYVCDQLVASALDSTNRKFRFTVHARQSDEPKVTLKDVDFTLDSKVTTTGVTDRDTSGNIYKDYEFNDAVEHTVSATVHFTYNGQTVTAEEPCTAKVTPEKPPVCIYNPELPPEHPDCKKTEEVQGVSTTLPKTGPAAGVAGLFAGASIAGGAFHKIILRRRLKRDQ